MLGGVDAVEGLVGDVRATCDLGDREAGQALLGDDRRGRVNDPLLLAFDDRLAGQVAAAAGQPPLGAAGPLGGLLRPTARAG